MDEKDDLKEILNGIDQLHTPVDLEGAILQKIAEEERIKAQIARYRTNGLRALWASLVLTVILAVLFSLPNSIQTAEYAIMTYASVGVTLLVLFVQLEMGRTNGLNHLKTNGL